MNILLKKSRIYYAIFADPVEYYIARMADFERFMKIGTRDILYIREISTYCGSTIDKKKIWSGTENLSLSLLYVALLRVDK